VAVANTDQIRSTRSFQKLAFLGGRKLWRVPRSASSSWAARSLLSVEDGRSPTKRGSFVFMEALFFTFLDD